MAEATSGVGRGRRKGACRRDSSQNLLWKEGRLLSKVEGAASWHLPA